LRKGAEGNIWTKEELSDGWVEKIELKGAA
jgi:hypothetical protein